VNRPPSRLRQIVLLDVGTAVLAIAVMAGTYLLVEPSGWLLVLCALVGASGATMGYALVPLRRGDPEGAVQWLAAANWSVALSAATIATFAWPMMLLASLLPVVLATLHVPRERLRWYLVVSVGVALAVTVLGVVQDVSGFTGQLPGWVPPAVTVLFTPFLAALVVLIALHNSARLQAALDETLASRSRLVAATDRERRRVERDLHDGAQHRLVALALRLRLVQDQCRSDPEAAATALDAVRDELHRAQRELRDLAHGVYPAVLTQRGLIPALEGAADRCPLPVTFDIGTLGRFSPDVEATVYFCCVEALQNVAKHAGPAAAARVSLAVDGDHLRFAVSDDGPGFDAGHRPDAREDGGSGLANLRDRVDAVGGTLEVRTVVGAGTTVAGVLPAHPCTRPPAVGRLDHPR
jgi:signal transduction histidine kinase